MVVSGIINSDFLNLGLDNEGPEEEVDGVLTLWRMDRASADMYKKCSGISNQAAKNPEKYCLRFGSNKSASQLECAINTAKLLIHARTEKKKFLRTLIVVASASNMVAIASSIAQFEYNMELSIHCVIVRGNVNDVRDATAVKSMQDENVNVSFFSVSDYVCSHLNAATPYVRNTNKYQGSFDFNYADLKLKLIAYLNRQCFRDHIKG